MAEVQQQEKQESGNSSKSGAEAESGAAAGDLLKESGLPGRDKDQDGPSEFSPIQAAALSEQFAQSFLEGDEKLRSEATQGRPVSQFLHEFKQLADFLTVEKRIDPSEISYNQQSDGSIHVTWKSAPHEGEKDPMCTTYRLTDSEEFQSLTHSSTAIWQKTLEALKDPDLSKPMKDGRYRVALIGIDLRFRTFVQEQEIIESPTASPGEKTSQ